jgi:predicted ATP-grasp superfamily ATP-dependent carboligase
MRLFVTEFITGGGFANHPLPDGLKQEGLLMLNSVLADCSRIHHIQLTTCLDTRITLDHSNVDVYPVEDSADYMQQVSKLAQASDYAWVIAPESSGVLESLVSQLAKQNIPTINCDAESIRVTGDKITASRY